MIFIFILSILLLPQTPAFGIKPIQVRPIVNRSNLKLFPSSEIVTLIQKVDPALGM